MGFGQSKQVIVEPEVKPKEYTIVFFGETGVGKSTTICSFENYLKLPTFDAAKSSRMKISIPLKFSLKNKSQQEEMIEVSPEKEPNINEDFNSVGQSVTQHPKIYKIKNGNNIYKIIDTPGLLDTRGKKQDELNKELIKNMINQQDQIHLILFVFKTNESRLRNETEYVTRQLLSLFPKSALNNVGFLFTFGAQSSYVVGESLGMLKTLQTSILKSHGKTFNVDENSCCIDNDSFKYLLGKEREIVDDSTERFQRLAWETSARNIKQFLNTIPKYKPVSVKHIIEVQSHVLEALSLIESAKKMEKHVLQQNRANFEERLNRIKNEAFIADIGSFVLPPAE